VEERCAGRESGIGYGMRLARANLALIASLNFAGCGYVHFGRAPSARPSDAALAAAYADLMTQHKILKQELALARKEGDTLRIALEHTGGAVSAAGSANLVARLNETSKELAALRVSYSKLKEEALKADTRSTAAAKNDAQLQDENTRLRADLDRVRGENRTLAEQLKLAAARSERAEAEVAQLNMDLVAQKEARTRAEQATLALRTQLDAVIAHGGGASTPAGDSTNVISVGSALRDAKAPPVGR
jgi:hypothetical protein